MSVDRCPFYPKSCICGAEEIKEQGGAHIWFACGSESSHSTYSGKWEWSSPCPHEHVVAEFMEIIEHCLRCKTMLGIKRGTIKVEMG